MDIAGLCFSQLPILRCASFSRLENQILIIPTALEVIFSTTLIFTNWNSNKRFLFITAEGWIYLALAILELLSHSVSEVRTSLNVFRIIDTTIAAASSLPVLFYTLFLYLFMRSDLIDILPSRFQHVCKYTLIIFIPAIVALNELASLLGISYRLISTSPTQSAIYIGFANGQEQDTWTFLTSIALALHTAYQAINFCLAFFRIAKAFFIKRQIEEKASDEAFMFNGIGWMAGGLKLGAIETVVGFAPQSGFGGALTRRILRFLSRACLCIGIVKGKEVHENFARVKDEIVQSKPRGKLLISNPRLSTFMQMSPSATSFHAAPRAPIAGKSKLSEVQNGLPGMGQFSTMKDDNGQITRQRVTVLHQGDAPPTLHMRFSALDMPSPAVITDIVKSQSNGDAASVKPPRRARSLHYASSVHSTVEVARTPIFARHTRAFSEHSTNDSLNSILAVRELADQFPGLPPRVTNKSQVQTPQWKDPYPTAPLNQQASLTRGDSNATQSSRASKISRSLSTSSSIRRKPVPRISDYIDPFSEDDDEKEVPVPHPEMPVHPAEVPRVPVTAPAVTHVAPRLRHMYNDSWTESNGSTTMTNFSASAAGYRRSLTNETDATTPDNEDPFIYDDQGKSQAKNVAAYSQPAPPSPQSAIQAVHDYVVDMPEEDEEVETRIRKAIPTARIKSVGNAPRRSTPQPIKSSSTRGSIYIQPILIPPKPEGMPVPYQGQEQGEIAQSVTSNYSNALRDSDIFGGPVALAY